MGHRNTSKRLLKAIHDPEQLVTSALDLHGRVQAFRETDLISRLSNSRVDSASAKRSELFTD